MALRTCAIPGCPILTSESHCPTHRTEARRRRGTTTQMGLGWQHQKRRARLVPAALNTPCPDCGRLMTDPAQMVADHRTPRSVDPASVADRVHCRDCSNRQGGRLSQRGN